MNRRLRRELSKRKWISRAKKVYNAQGKFYIPVSGIKADIKYDMPIRRNKLFKECESITDFLDSSKYAKKLKKCTSPYKTKMSQYEDKMENRKDRHKAKSIIQEEIQEHEQDLAYDCFSCMYYNGFCTKGLIMKDNCLEYWD